MTEIVVILAALVLWILLMLKLLELTHVEPTHQPEPEPEDSTSFLGDLAYVSYLSWCEYAEGKRALQCQRARKW